MDELDILTFENRRKELLSLLESSQSRTSKNLLTEAISISDDNFKLYTEISYRLFEYATKLTQEKKDNIDKYNVQFELLKKNLEQVPSLSTPKEQKDILIAYYQVNLEILDSMSKKDKNLNYLLTSAFQFVGQELKITLFDYILKPNQLEFKLDVIADAVSLIAEKFIPYLGDTKGIINLVKKAKKKSYLKEGDKLFQYIERYIDASELWRTLAIAFNKNAFD